MDQKQIAKQMVEFNKSIFDNSFAAMTALHDQTEKLISFLEKAVCLPEEGKQLIGDWINSYKKGREDFKITVDERYGKVADFFAKIEKK